jgi:hypothetical protein
MINLIGWSCMFYFMALSSAWHNYRKPNSVFRYTLYAFSGTGLALQTAFAVWLFAL